MVNSTVSIYSCTPLENVVDVTWCSALGYHFGRPRFDSPPRPGCTSSLLLFSSRLQHFINSLRRRLHSSINQTSKQFLMLTAKGERLKNRCIYNKMMTTKPNLRYLDWTRPWTADKQSKRVCLYSGSVDCAIDLTTIGSSLSECMHAADACWLLP